MKKYKIVYTETWSIGEVKEMLVEAKNKYEAYDKAVYEIMESLPFGAYVDGYYTKSGKYHGFNTSFGNAY